MASDNGVVIEFSRPGVLRGRTVGGEHNGFTHTRARGTISSPEHEACGGVDHVVVNIDSAGIAIRLISRRMIKRWTGSVAKIVVKVNMVEVHIHLPGVVPNVIEGGVMYVNIVRSSCQDAIKELLK